jgi:mannose-1-phosphate guanylyltransferase/phosphomannomutase
LIDYVVDWLATSGIRTVTVCANGSTTEISRHLESQPSRIAIGYHADKSPRGAAGCVKDAAGTSNADAFIVSDGSSIPLVDVAQLIAHHRSTGAAITIVVHRRTLSTGEAHLEPTGTYVFDREVLELIPATTFHDIKENLIPNAYRRDYRIELFEVSEAFPRVLDASSYIAANHWMAARLVDSTGSAESKSSRDLREVEAHPSAWIDDDATIVGPVVIGRGARVHASAVLVGPTVIGAGTVVGPGATLARSVTWENCDIGEGAIVDRCLLSEQVTVESRTRIVGLLRVNRPAHRRWFTVRQPLRKRSALESTRPFAKPALS